MPRPKLAYLQRNARIVLKKDKSNRPATVKSNTCGFLIIREHHLKGEFFNKIAYHIVKRGECRTHHGRFPIRNTKCINCGCRRKWTEVGEKEMLNCNVCSKLFSTKFKEEN